MTEQTRTELQKATIINLNAFRQTYIQMVSSEIQLLDIKMGWVNNNDYEAPTVGSRYFEQFCSQRNVNQAHVRLALSLIDECQEVGVEVEYDLDDMNTFINSIGGASINEEYEAGRTIAYSNLSKAIDTALNTNNSDDAYVPNSNELDQHIRTAVDTGIELGEFGDTSNRNTVGRVKRLKDYITR